MIWREIGLSRVPSVSYVNARAIKLKYNKPRLTREDDVPGLEREKVGDVGDEAGGLADHVLGARLLPRLAVNLKGSEAGPGRAVGDYDDEEGQPAMGTTNRTSKTSDASRTP